MKTNTQKVFTISSFYSGEEYVECSVLYQGSTTIGALGHVVMLCKALSAELSADAVVGYDGDGNEICRFNR